MRLSVLLALSLSVCLAVPRAAAQSCIAATRLDTMTMEGPCEGAYPWRCDPNAPVTLRAHIYSDDPFATVTCPTPITWDLGDGQPTLTTTTSTIEHTFPNPGRFLNARLSVVIGNATKKIDFSYVIAYGYFDITGPVEVHEGATATLTVTRSGDPNRTATVDYGTNLPAGPSGTLTFQALETSKILSVPIPDDTIWNGDGFHNAEVYLRNPGGGYAFENYYSVDGDPRVSDFFEVVDNDVATRHKCAQTSINVSETAGGATFQLERSGNLANATFGTVHVHTSGFWQWGSSFHSIEFAPGQATQALFVPLPNDAVYSGQQTTTVTCGGQGPGVHDSTSTVDLTVREDEAFPTLVVPSTLEVDETDALQEIEIPISIVPQFGYYPNITITGHGQTASDDDFEVSPNFGLVSPIVFKVTGDDLPESDERFSIRIAGDLNKSILITIRDDDRPAFPYAFGKSEYEADENAARVVINRTGDLSAAASLTLHIQPASATQWPVESVPVHFAAGVPSVEIDIPADDEWFTGDRQAILDLELDGFIGASANLLLRDDESMPTLSIGDASVLEGGPNQTSRIEFPVLLSEPLGYEVNTTVTISHGTTDARDFASPATMTAFIYPGEMTARAIVVVAGDAEHEQDETFTASIAGCCTGLVTVARGTATGTIRNDDGAPTVPVYRLSTAAEHREEDRWLPVTVTRLGRVDTGSVVTVKLHGARRAAATLQIRFAANELEKTVRFYIEDALLNDATAQVELFAGDVLVEQTTVRIRDNDSPPDCAILNWPTTFESAGVITFDVRCSPSPEPISLHLRTSSTTASTPQDFDYLDTTLVFAPDSPRRRKVDVTLHDDHVREEPETFELYVAGITGATSAFNKGIGTILDNDRPHVRVAPAARVGQPVPVTVHFDAVAPAGQSLELVTGSGGVLDMPKTVAIPEGATSVTFEAKALRAGNGAFVVILPPFLESDRLPAAFVAYEITPLVVSPATLQLAPGDELVVGGEGKLDGVFISSANPSIAATAVHSLPDGKFAIFVYGVTAGRTEIVIQQSPWEPENVVRIPVTVSNAVGRRRSAGR